MGYFFNINVIGAYIFAVIFITLYIKGPSLSDIHRRFTSLSKYIHTIILILLAILEFQTMYNGIRSWGIFFWLYYVLDIANLWIHEAGHGLCIFFGEFIHSLGATLLQLFIPLFLLIRSIKNKYKELSVIFLFWLGQNLPGIATYMADARTQKLQLLGGGTHDWYYLFGKLGILEFDTIIAKIVAGIGIIIMTCSIIWYGKLIYQMHYFKVNQSNS